MNNPNVRDRFSYALKRGLPITINNDNLGGEPDVGKLKTCAVEYQLAKGGPVLCKVATEGT